jgi:hypothetical protein
MPSVDTAILLDNHARRLHRVLFDALLMEGDVPALSVLADHLHTSAEMIPDGAGHVGGRRLPGHRQR